MQRLLLLIALMLVLPSVTAAQDRRATVDEYAVRVDKRQVEVLFRIRDRETGRDVAGLQGRDVVVLEDGVPIAGPLDLSEARTDMAKTTLTVELSAQAGGAGPMQGSKPAILNSVGSTIGVVFDASEATNKKGDPTDYVAKGRELIEAFLEAGRATAPGDPEALSLFVPLSVPAVDGESLQPSTVTDFLQDRNIVITAVREQPPRPKDRKTNVLDTIRLAVTRTAEAAARRGTDAYLLVVTDGGDAASVGSFDALVQEATARKVKLFILGVGSPNTVANNEAALRTLALSTGGAYISRPDAAQVQALYRASVGITGQSAYILRYMTTLPDDGKSHNLTIRVSGPASGESGPIPLPPIAGVASSELLPLGPVLQGYVMRGLGVAIAASFLATLLLVLFRRISGGSASHSAGMTRR